MIKKFESIYKKLEYLFIQILPEYIDKINKEYNDGIIIKPFVNTKLTEECLKIPCFKFELLETECSEKDRIIENNIYNFSLEIKTKNVNNEEIKEIFRYYHAIDKMLIETNTSYLEIRIVKLIKNTIFFRTVL